jgi:hypothetical protein
MQSTTTLVGLCDVEWVWEGDSCKKTTCYVLLLKGGVTSWSSKQLHTLTFTSTKAKYNITIEVAKYAI